MSEREFKAFTVSVKFFTLLDTIETYLDNAETFIIMYLSISSTICLSGADTAQNLQGAVLER